MKALFHNKGGRREVTEMRAERLDDVTNKVTAQVDPADKMIVIGPPGCCCVSERPLPKPRKRS